MNRRLKWSQQSKKFFLDAIRNCKAKAPPSGISCIFLKLNDFVGAKLYCSKVSRDKAHRMQSHAANYGLAPLSGECFDHEFYYMQHKYEDAEVRYNKVYGYLTEFAHVPKHISHEEIGALKRGLYNIGLVNDDLFAKNVGFVGNKLVCIDFDFVSCQWKRGRKKNDLF